MLKADAQNGPERRDARAWAWGIAGAVTAFAALTAIGVREEAFGWSFVVGAPFVCGMIIGRWVRLGRVLQVLAAVIVVGAVILGAVTTSIAGSVCGAVFAWIASAPLIIGVFVGVRLSRPRKPTGTVACVAVVAMLIPLEPALMPQQSAQTVSTSAVFASSAEDTFRRITFYEDTTGEPPRLLRIALPRPIATVGDARHVGDRPRCLYDAGYIDKEITAVKRPSYYAFKVIRQVGVESHAVLLVDGSFRLSPLGGNRTRVVLTTRYIPKLTARPAWAPFEHSVIHALHRHVLQEMRTR